MMALTTREPPAAPASGPGDPAPLGIRHAEPLVVVAVALVAVVLGIASHAHHPHALPELALGIAASLVLFLVCGYALAFALVPRSWGALVPLLALPLGAAVSGLALTALGLAHVPLDVSLWVVLAGGVVAAVVVRRRARGTGQAQPRIDRVELGSWLALLGVLACVALIPSWRLASDTIYGENPDAHQVVGIAVLFQHVSPTGTDASLPIDTVPPAWRFRYPIFYPLAAVSNLSRLDPIKLFTPMAALLLALSALGFGALAIVGMRSRPAVGMLAAAAIGLSVIPLYLIWHPYWNQLWGLAILPYAFLFGWHAVTARDGRTAILFALMLVTLWLAYPLALPYPLLLVGALLVAHWRRPRLPAMRRRRNWIWAIVAVLVLIPALAGAALKLAQGVGQLLSPHSSLWSGDVKALLPVGRFVGTGGGILAALAVLAVAAVGLLSVPRRTRLALGIVIAILCLLDLRFRLASTGAYMDFKHLSYVGALVVMLAAVAVGRMLFSGKGLWIATGLGLALVWLAAVLVQDRRTAIGTNEQVTSELLQIRTWARELPRGASVRVDIPPSGTQLWAVYMLGDHPVDSTMPVRGTTYAVAHFGLRADYSLSVRYQPVPVAGMLKPYPLPPYARNPPLFENDQFVLRKIDWPARLASYPNLASTTLVEP